MRLLFFGFLMLIFCFVSLIAILMMFNGKGEIVEIQSPPLFAFNNPYFKFLKELKSEMILQKVLSETDLYGVSPFLLESTEKFKEIKYYFDIMKADYNLVEIDEKYWWGKKRIYYLSFKGNEFFYIPHVKVSEKGEGNFGKQVLKALIGVSSYISEEDYKNKIKMLLLQRYGVAVK
ncbi:MAG: hypothetical protein H0Z24_04900 [Thermosipho sp. (in: Bacteria)]|nr:hypothetical protein [Thermosipho sp. (in: thermotogales)]